MRIIPLIATYMIALILCYETSAKVRDTSLTIAARQKRFLIFQEGINWVQMVAGIGFPVELRQESVTWGATVKSYYLLPTNSSDFLNPSIELSRKVRSPNRWEVYSGIKTFMDRFNLGNGKVCLMRAICEAAVAPFDQKSGLLAEIMHILLTPSTTNEEINDYTDLEYHAAEKFGREANDCARLFSNCNIYLLDQVSKLFM